MTVSITRQRKEDVGADEVKLTRSEGVSLLVPREGNYPFTLQLRPLGWGRDIICQEAGVARCRLVVATVLDRGRLQECVEGLAVAVNRETLESCRLRQLRNQGIVSDSSLTLVGNTTGLWVGDRGEAELALLALGQNGLRRLDGLDQVTLRIEFVDVRAILVANPEPKGTPYIISLGLMNKAQVEYIRSIGVQDESLQIKTEMRVSRVGDWHLGIREWRLRVSGLRRTNT